MNKVHMVEEIKVGVVMEGYEEELVKAEEVEAKVKLVMASGSGDGKELRQRLLTAKEMTVEVLKEGGSSDVAFDAFLTDLLKNTCTESSACEMCNGSLFLDFDCLSQIVQKIAGK